MNFSPVCSISSLGVFLRLSLSPLPPLPGDILLPYPPLGDKSRGEEEVPNPPRP